MSWETAINGRFYEAVGERIIPRGGNWIQETYILGNHPSIGRPVVGEQGEETILETIIPASLVDSSITVNGKPNDILRHRVDPEFDHLLPPKAPLIQPLERLLQGIEFDLSPDPVPQSTIGVDG